MTEDHVFPEDTGTGASRGDNADAANFGAFAQHELLSDYKASGLSIQNVDYQNLTFDLTAGKAFVKDASAATAQSGDTRDQGVVYEVEVASRTAVDLTDATTNEVFIDVDLTTDDSVSITVLTDGTTPSAPFLKIAEIDTSTDTLDESYANSLDVDGKDLTDGVTTIYDSSANEIPEATLGTISNSTLSNSSVTLNANDGISGGGSVSLGDSVGVNINPSDFVGSGLTTDGSNNIDLSNDSVTITSGTDLTGGGAVTLGNSVTINHGDTSSQGDVSADAGEAITDINLNPQGHVTGIGTENFDNRYIDESGDTMTGNLTVKGGSPAYKLDDNGGSIQYNSELTINPTFDTNGGTDFGPLGIVHRTDLDVRHGIEIHDEDFVGIKNAVFKLENFTSDPSGTRPNGSMWYRSDLD